MSKDQLSAPVWEKWKRVILLHFNQHKVMTPDILSLLTGVSENHAGSLLNKGVETGDWHREKPAHSRNNRYALKPFPDSPVVHRVAGKDMYTDLAVLWGCSRETAVSHFLSLFYLRGPKNPVPRQERDDIPPLPTD